MNDGQFEIEFFHGAVQNPLLNGIEIIDGVGDTTPPAVPTGLAASSAGGSVVLDWNDNGEPDLAGYHVYRAQATGGPYIQIASGLTVSTYTDATVTSPTIYYYVVTAVDTAGNESLATIEVGLHLRRRRGVSAQPPGRHHQLR